MYDAAEWLLFYEVIPLYFWKHFNVGVGGGGAGFNYLYAVGLFNL